MNISPERVNIQANVIPAMLSTRYLELILLPTEQCNFRCTYCYEDFTIGRMKPDTVLGIKRLIERRVEGLENLKISWFGGEPLSARDIVYDISEHAQLLANKYQINYTASMTTNGFLLGETVASKLVNVGVNEFQISLDGPREVHDMTRRRIDGSGSFDKIWQNLSKLKHTHLLFNVLIRIHITPENYDSQFRLIDDLVSDFGGDNRFALFFKPIANLGGPHAKTITVLNKEARKTAIQALIDAVGQKMRIVSAKQSQVPYVCYASHANSFVIRADGSVGKCTVALTSPSNVIGRLRSDGTLEIDQLKLRPWLRGMQTQNAADLKCPLNGLTSVNQSV